MTARALPKAIAGAVRAVLHHQAVGEGSGLGLAVAHGVVSECGGRIELVQGRLPGAAFRIALPLSEEENHD